MNLCLPKLTYTYQSIANNN